MDSIKFACAQCGQVISAPADHAGSMVECDRCGAARRVPGDLPKTSVQGSGLRSERVLNYGSISTRSGEPPNKIRRRSRLAMIIVIGGGIGILLILLVFGLSSRGSEASDELRNSLIDLLGVAAMIAIAIWVISFGVRSALKHQSKMAQPAMPIIESAPDDAGNSPGVFEIRGVNRKTRADAVLSCEADSPGNAKIKAELQGIVVSSVRRISDR
jgi:hypothetical protein